MNVAEHSVALAPRRSSHLGVACRLACRVAWAFVVRSAATYASYRAKLSLGLASLVLSLVTFSFVGRVVDASGTGFVERYGTSYTSFVIVGVIVHGIASAGLSSFRATVRREQLQGTLELLVTTRVPVPALLLLSGLGELAIAGAGGAALLALASAALDVRLCLSLPAVAAVGLYAAAMCGIGLVSAGVILVSKEGEPVSWAFSAAAGLLGGVYFPVDMLPPWLRGISAFLPTTHALHVARAGLSGHHDPSSLLRPLVLLGLTAAVALAAGLLTLKWGYRRARRAGTLGEY